MAKKPTNRSIPVASIKQLIEHAGLVKAALGGCNETVVGETPAMIVDISAVEQARSLCDVIHELLAE